MKHKIFFLTIFIINIINAEVIFKADEFKSRRIKLAKELEPNAIAIFQGAPSETGYVKFRQYNEFYYLTGIETPHAYLLIKGGTGETSLYLPHKNIRRERSEGPIFSSEDINEVKLLNGVENVYSTEMMGEHLWP